MGRKYLQYFSNTHKSYELKAITSMYNVKSYNPAEGDWILQAFKKFVILL